MKSITVSRETAEKLKAAGWVKDSIFTYCPAECGIRLRGGLIYRCGLKNTRCSPDIWLPAPTLGEFKGEVTEADLICYYTDNVNCYVHSPRFYEEFARWVIVTLTDVEALAKVWLWKEERNA